MSDLKNRYDIVFLFDATDCNPNGDPDMDNMPRTDPETSHGLVSDVCLKRKVRDYHSRAGEKIFYTNGSILNDIIDAAHDTVEKKSKKLTGEEKVKAVQMELLRNFVDLREFGAVLSTGRKAGQVRGPVQAGIARTIDPVHIQHLSITRKSVATQKEAQEQIQKNGTIVGTFGSKYIIPYGLYKVIWNVNPAFAQKTDYSLADFKKFLSALSNLFEWDKSSGRMGMYVRGLYVFEHKCEKNQAFSLGKDKLVNCIERVKISRKDQDKVPRSFEDYTITLNKKDLPQGLNVYDLSDGNIDILF